MCPNFIEPFAGSLAVLLARPGGAGKIETVNDRDRYLANFWRAVSAEPEAVRRHADWPVNEADLHARHKWLVNQAEFRERMHTDPDFYDVKIAGWWVWGLCQWIGGGWCVEPNNHKHPKLDGIGKGVHSGRGHRGCEADWRKRPELDGTSASGAACIPMLLSSRSASSPTPSRRRRNGDTAASIAQRASEDLRGRQRRGIHGVTASDAQAYSPGRRPILGSAGQRRPPPSRSATIAA
jgi:hypothetical protein